jgi:hypothetical protein
MAKKPFALRSLPSAKSTKERNRKVDVPINFFLKMAKKPFALHFLPSAKSPSGRNFYSDGGVSPSLK